MRVLYLQATWVPPPQDFRADRFVLLSDDLEGDVLHPVWYKEPQEVDAEFGAGASEEYHRGRFGFHWFLSLRYNGAVRKLLSILFYVRKGLELHRQNPYQCIVVYSHMMPALAALVLKALTGAKLVVEIMTAPHLSFQYEHYPKRTFADRLLRVYSDLSLHLSVLLCDRVHLLYPHQLGAYPLLRKKPCSIFHDFVPVSLIPPLEGEREKVVLFVGSPWFLKGVDLLVEAFKRISGEFPDVQLRIVGHMDKPAEMAALVEGFPRIEVIKGTPHPQTMAMISRAMIMVLPSRCEGLARVLIEGMSAGLPVIATEVGGSSSCIRDGENGFVIPPEDVDALTARLRQLLSDGELREYMGSRGKKLAAEKYTEQVYKIHFTQMVSDTILGNP